MHAVTSELTPAPQLASVSGIERGQIVKVGNSVSHPCRVPSPAREAGLRPHPSGDLPVQMESCKGDPHIEALGDGNLCPLPYHTMPAPVDVIGTRGMEGRCETVARKRAVYDFGPSTDSQMSFALPPPSVESAIHADAMSTAWPYDRPNTAYGAARHGPPRFVTSAWPFGPAANRDRSYRVTPIQMQQPIIHSQIWDDEDIFEDVSGNYKAQNLRTGAWGVNDGRPPPRPKSARKLFQDDVFETNFDTSSETMAPRPCTAVELAAGMRDFAKVIK